MAAQLRANLRASQQMPSYPQAFDFDPSSMLNLRADCEWWLPALRSGALGLTHDRHLRILANRHPEDDFLPVPAAAQLGLKVHLEALRYIKEGSLFNYTCTTCKLSTPFEEQFLEAHGYGLRRCTPFQERRNRQDRPRDRLPLVSASNYTEADREELRSRSHSEHNAITSTSSSNQAGNEENLPENRLNRVRRTLPPGTTISPNHVPRPETEPAQQGLAQKRPQVANRPGPASKKLKLDTQGQPALIDLTIKVEDDPETPPRDYVDLTVDQAPLRCQQLMRQARHDTARVALHRVDGRPTPKPAPAKQVGSRRRQAKPAATQPKRKNPRRRPSRPRPRVRKQATPARATRQSRSASPLPSTSGTQAALGQSNHLPTPTVDNPEVNDLPPLVDHEEEPPILLDGLPVTGEVDTGLDNEDANTARAALWNGRWATAPDTPPDEGGVAPEIDQVGQDYFNHPELRTIAPAARAAPSLNALAELTAKKGYLLLPAENPQAGASAAVTGQQGDTPPEELQPQPYLFTWWWENPLNFRQQPDEIRIEHPTAGWIAPIITQGSTGTNYRCQYPGCSCDFSETHNWKQHYRGLHLKIHAYFCVICAADFPYQQGLTQHLSVYHDLRPGNPIWPTVQRLTCQRRESHLDDPPAGMLPTPTHARTKKGHFAPKDSSK